MTDIPTIDIGTGNDTPTETEPVENDQSSPNLTGTILESLTRTELGFIAKVLKVPVGKSRTDTIKNLNQAFTQGKAQFKLKVTISTPPEPGQQHANAFFMKTLKSYEGDSTVTEGMKWNKNEKVSYLQFYKTKHPKS